MKSLFSFFLFMFFLVLICGAAVSIVIFAFDVIKWHPREERVKVIPSADFESEVIVDERRDNDSGSGADGSGDSDSDSGNNVLGSNNDDFFKL